MIIVKKAIHLAQYLQDSIGNSLSTGFVPTMGALHQGHLSLVEICKKEQDVTIASIFVNPTQFNELADYQKYPVTLEKDTRLLVDAGCDVLFLPAVEEIYPQGLQPVKHYDLGSLESILEGLHRPGHFQGVCQVVERLLRITRPSHMYLGRKDYQQCMVIRRMLDITGLQVQLHIVPTVREKSGLAMSSRNMRLNEKEKQQAASIFRQLQMIKKSILDLPISELTGMAARNLLNEGFTKVDYVTIADSTNLQPVNKVQTGQHVVALIAAYMGDVRLIDNMEITA